MAKVEQKGDGNQPETHELPNSAGLDLICGTTPNNNLVIHSKIIGWGTEDAIERTEVLC